MLSQPARRPPHQSAAAPIRVLLRPFLAPEAFCLPTEWPVSACPATVVLEKPQFGPNGGFVRWCSRALRSAGQWARSLTEVIVPPVRTQEWNSRPRQTGGRTQSIRRSSRRQIRLRPHRRCACYARRDLVAVNPLL